MASTAPAVPAPETGEIISDLLEFATGRARLRHPALGQDPIFAFGVF